MSNTSLTRKEYLCALLVVVIWGSNFVVIKAGLKDLSPMVLGALRFGLAAVPLVFFVRPPALPWRWIAGYGLIQGFGQFALLFTALKFGMPTGMASLVLQTQAFFTLLIAVSALHEPARRHHWIGLGVAALGLLMIAFSHGNGPGEMPLFGFILTLGSAVMWATSNIMVRLISRRAPGYNPMSLIVWSSLAPVLPFLCVAVLIDGWTPVLGMFANIGWREILSAVYLAGLATLLGYTLWTRLLTAHPAGKIAPFSLLVPVVGLWAASIFYDEVLLPLQWLGAVGVLLGLLINQLGDRYLGSRRR